MILQLSGERKIEDARSHEPEIVSELRKLLARGVYQEGRAKRRGSDQRAWLLVTTRPASRPVGKLART